MTEQPITRNGILKFQQNQDFTVELHFDHDLFSFDDIFYNHSEVLKYLESTRQYEQKINDPYFHFGASELVGVASYFSSAIMLSGALKRIYVKNRRTEYVVVENVTVVEARARIDGHFVSNKKDSTTYHWEESIYKNTTYTISENNEGYFRVFDRRQNIVRGELKKEIVDNVIVFKEMFTL